MSENNRSYNEDEIPLHAFILFSISLTALIIMKHTFYLTCVDLIHLQIYRKKWKCEVENIQSCKSLSAMHQGWPQKVRWSRDAGVRSSTRREGNRLLSRVFFLLIWYHKHLIACSGGIFPETCTVFATFLEKKIWRQPDTTLLSLRD